MSLHWIGTSCGISTCLSAFPSMATDAFFCPPKLTRLLGSVFGVQFTLRPIANLKLDCPQKGRWGEVSSWLAEFFTKWDFTFVWEEQGSRSWREGFLALSEREGLIVCCCWNRSQRPVQFFGQGWAKLPCHKIIAERISVEFRGVSKGALCYSSLQAEGRTSALGQALLLTSSRINEHAFVSCVCSYSFLVPLNLLWLSL